MEEDYGDSYKYAVAKKKSLPSLCAKLCLWHVSTPVSTVVSVETERRRNRVIDTCMSV